MAQGKIYAAVDTANSVWQLEPRNVRHAARERTTSTASTVSTHSSSYALVSDPDISSSFAASLEGAATSDAEDASAASPARSSPSLSFADEAIYPAPMRRRMPLQALPSRAGSPPGPSHPSLTSSLESLESAAHAPRAGRLLTVHLEKAASAIWPALIIGPAPPDSDVSDSATVLVFDANAEAAANKYNMDATSLALIALELCDIRKERAEAFEYFLCVVVYSLVRQLIVYSVGAPGKKRMYLLRRCVSCRTICRSTAPPRWSLLPNIH